MQNKLQDEADKYCNTQNRLESFTLLKWFFMPKELNAMECAKSGYINIGANKIRCIWCQHLVHFKTQVGVVLPDQTLHRMINRVIYGHKPDWIFHKSKGKDTKGTNNISRIYSLRKATKKNSETSATVVDIETIKEKIQRQNQDEYKTQVIKFHLDWDIQFLSNMESFESLSNQTTPLIHPNTQKLLNEETLDMLWLPKDSSICAEKDSFYTPALLSIFGWKACPTSTSYTLTCQSQCRQIPLSILHTTPSLTQSWSQIQSECSSKSLLCPSSSPPDMASWLQSQSQFVLCPLSEHMEYCPEHNLRLVKQRVRLLSNFYQDCRQRQKKIHKLRDKSVRHMLHDKVNNKMQFQNYGEEIHREEEKARRRDNKAMDKQQEEQQETLEEQQEELEEQQLTLTKYDSGKSMLVTCLVPIRDITKDMSVTEIKLIMNKKLKANIEKIKEIQKKNDQIKKMLKK